MKIVTVLGSPRKKGNTAKALGRLEKELISHGHNVERVNMSEVKVQGCVECYTCRTSADEPGCPTKDDFLHIYERMAAAEAIVYASPLFCWEFSSQIKPLIDRQFCLVKNYGSPAHKSLLEGKKAALLVTCAGPVEGNADLVLKVFERMALYTKCTVVGTEVIAFCTSPDNMPDSAEEQASSLADKISGKQ